MSGSIYIPNFDPTDRYPGVVEAVTGEDANTATVQQRVLIVANKTSAGTASPNVAQIVSGTRNSGVLTGSNSVATQMVARYFQQDPQAQVWVLPLADAPGSTAAQGGLKFVGTALSSGTVAIYIGGLRLAVGVSIGDTAVEIATNFLNAVDLSGAVFGIIPNSTGDGFNVTFAHGGLIGNDLPILVNVGGSKAGEILPDGVTVNVTQMSGGTVNPDVLAGLDNLSSLAFDTIIHCYNDSISLNDFQNFLSDAHGRWSPDSLIFGHGWGAYRGTFGACDTFGMGRNDQHHSIVPIPLSMPEPTWLVVTDFAANCFKSLRDNPNIPLQDIVTGCMAPALVGDYWSPAQNKVFLFNGLCAWTVDDATGQVIIKRMVTTYQTNAAGSPDDSFLDVETEYALMDLNRSWNIEMASDFAQKILVIDGSILPGGSAQVTSQTVRGSTIAWYSKKCSEGRAQDPEGFARDIIAQNAGNGTVLTTLPYRLDNQLRKIAGVVNFSKP